jgi:hypothetical protein
MHRESIAGASAPGTGTGTVPGTPGIETYPGDPAHERLPAKVGAVQRPLAWRSAHNW